MVEETVSRNGVVAMLWWVATVSVYLVAAAVMFAGHWKIAILVAEGACGVAAYAAVRTVRCYSARVCELIRRLDDRSETVPLQRVH